MEHALRVANELVKDEVASGKIEFRTIEGMTIENRVAKMQSLPDEVLAACKECDVLVKGPFITPRAGDGLPNLVSANSLLRRELQLFAAVRPIRIPDKGIDWTFFRENIEGEYILGNRGIRVGDELAIDFKVCTKPGAPSSPRPISSSWSTAISSRLSTASARVSTPRSRYARSWWTPWPQSSEARPLCRAST